MAEPPERCSEDGGSKDTAGLTEGPAGEEERGEGQLLLYNIRRGVEINVCYIHALQFSTSRATEHWEEVPWTQMKTSPRQKITSYSLDTVSFNIHNFK